MKVGVAKENAPGERRVALVPEALGKLTAAGLDILVETGAGAGSALPDAAYAGRRRDGRDDRGALPGRGRRAQGRQAVRRRGRDAAPGPGGRRVPRPAHRPAAGEVAGGRGRHGDQPRRDPADALARADDGRAQLAGQRRRLQGGPDRGERVSALLPAPDHGGRHREARQRPDPRDRRRRPAGHRDGQAPRRRRPCLRRPARDARAGGEPRREVREAQDDDRRHRRRRLRPRADRRGARRPAGGAQRGHRRDGRGHHHRPGPRPQAAGPRDRGGREPDEVGLGDRRHGRLEPGRQLRAVARPARRSRPPTGSRSSPPTTCRPRCRPAPPPSTPGTSRRCSSGWSRTANLHLDFEDEVTKSTVITHGGAILSDAVKKLLEPAAPATGGPA